MDQPTRERLIEAAAELLDRGGRAAVTLREVGRAAGISHNAPYRHFVDKDDLLAAVAARELERLTFNPHGGVAGMVRAYVNWALDRPERFRLTFGRWDRHHPALDAAATRSRQAMIEGVRLAQASGTLPTGDPDRLGALLLATAQGAVSMSLDGHLAPDGKGRADPSGLVEDLLEHLRPRLPKP